jgi:hypothetical protein
MQAGCQYPFPQVDYSPEFDMDEGQKENPQPVVLKGYLAYIANRLGVPPWGQLLILALATVIGVGYIHIGKMDDRLGEINQKLATLPLEISNTLLSQARTDMKLGHYDHATRATEAATAIVAKASVDKIPAPSTYLEEALSSLNTMGATATDANFVATVHSARLLLAEYRSALEPLPQSRGPRRTIEGTVLASALPGNGTTLIFVGDPNTELITVGNGGGLQDLNIVAEHGGYIVLDGGHFDNVVFAGANIKYYGGPLNLHSVRFVNCTFDLSSPTGNGARLIDYVALAQNKLTTQS